jgi:hypothetical protein
MKSEMDIMNMDERQQMGWLLANRLTLIIVGIVWLGMIAWEILQNRIPYFLIVMVPTFAVVRFLSYLYYTRKP